MSNFKRYLSLFNAGAMITAAALSVTAVAQEHPKEHPQEQVKEQPKVEKHELTIQELAEAVKEYINNESKKGKGYFLVQDDKQKKTLWLKLKKIHEDRLSPLGDDIYFVCADFKATDGNTYDVDIFMKGEDKESLKATEVIVHKDNGKPRYSWYEENGVWKRTEN